MTNKSSSDNQLPAASKGKIHQEIIRVFLRLGLFAFGGPAAHIAMMEDEIVNRRKWVNKEKFVDMLGLTNLIPGPNSTEMAIMLGYAHGGKLGLLLAGVSFILPAMLIVLLFAVLYQKFGSVPSVGHMLDGIKPVVIAIVAQAVYRLGKTVLKNADAAIIAAAAFTAYMLGVKEIPLLLAAAALMLVIRLLRRPDKPTPKPRLHAFEPLSLGMLFLVFLKIGAVLYGSGYVLIAFLRTEFVERFGVLTSQQLIDAVAVGQFTPGPVFTTATFVGYVIHGFPGAIVSTVGIFLPSFLLVLILNPLLERLRASKTLSHILDGLNAGSVALMAAVTVQLGREALVSVPAVIIAIVSAFLLIRYKVNSTWLILGGGLIGLLLPLWR